MTPEQIIKAWKDPSYRESLGTLQLAAIPDHPSGRIELEEEDLLSFSGGVGFTKCANGCSYGGPCTYDVGCTGTWWIFCCCEPIAK